MGVRKLLRITRRGTADNITNRRGGSPVERNAQATAELAGYIAQMSAELMHMASAARLDMAAHFLSLAHVEAEIAARAIAPRDPPA